MRTIADSFSELLRSAGLDVELAATMADLPYRLGLVRSPEEGWESFVRLEPDQSLPRFAVRRDVPPGLVEAFVRAHHFAGFYGLTTDRLEDGQIASSEGLAQIQRRLLESWVDALGDATADHALARRLIVAAVDRAEAGIRRERDLRRGGDFLAYATAIRAKLDWIVLAARTLLETTGDLEGARVFTNKYHRVLLALQCRDDVVDAEEDRRLHGTSMAEALEMTNGALLRASVHLLRDATQLARRHGFDALAAWAAEQAATCDRHADRDFRRDDLYGLLLSWAAGGEDT